MLLVSLIYFNYIGPEVKKKYLCLKSGQANKIGSIQTKACTFKEEAQTIDSRESETSTSSCFQCLPCFQVLTLCDTALTEMSKGENKLMLMIKIPRLTPLTISDLCPISKAQKHFFNIWY